MNERNEIAKTLLKNTTNQFMKRFIENYISWNETDSDVIEMRRFDNCVKYIIDSNFSVENWELHEIPIHYSHCFINTSKNKMFDLASFADNEVIPRYLNEECSEVDAKTIEEAISKYNAYFCQKYHMPTIKEIESNLSNIEKNNEKLSEEKRGKMLDDLLDDIAIIIEESECEKDKEKAFSLSSYISSKNILRIIK